MSLVLAHAQLTSCSAAQGVDEGVVSLFTAAAAELLADMPAEQAVARALAHLTGQTSMQARTTACTCCLRFCVT